tara:strand:- start:87 stop:629 length:543 start_codon:yes stop_codon:yes gene_type:complete
MAKRGYRGKHPHNDVKVSKHGGVSNKSNPKLRAEYDKLHPKQKYSYIRTQQAFNPVGELTISGTLDLVAASQITMSSATGAVLSMKGVAAATTASSNIFQANGTAAQASNGIRDIINTQFAGNLTASVASEIVTVTQVEPGPDGNTAVTLGTGTTGVVAQTVTFNSTGANNSGSLNFING